MQKKKNYENKKEEIIKQCKKYRDENKEVINARRKEQRKIKKNK